MRLQRKVLLFTKGHRERVAHSSSKSGKVHYKALFRIIESGNRTFRRSLPACELLQLSNHGYKQSLVHRFQQSEAQEFSKIRSVEQNRDTNCSCRRRVKMNQSQVKCSSEFVLGKRTSTMISSVRSCSGHFSVKTVFRIQNVVLFGVSFSKLTTFSKDTRISTRNSKSWRTKSLMMK